MRLLLLLSLFIFSPLSLGATATSEVGPSQSSCDYFSGQGYDCLTGSFPGTNNTTYYYRYYCGNKSLVLIPTGGTESSFGGQYPLYYCDLPLPVPSCPTDTIPGGPIMGGSGAGVYNVSSCAYTCGTNYSKLDGFTSLFDAQECVGTGQEYVSSDPLDYSEPPPVCTVKDSLGRCLDMAQQEGGSCPSGTTYGRVNGQEVCVPSGTSFDPLDPGSQGLPDQGGDMQSEGTPDRAGTGGSSTGTGTSSSSGTSTTTDNGDGTSTTAGSETTETVGPSTFGGHGDPASWWESQYPEGASGIAAKFSQDVGNGPFMAMLNPLKSLPNDGAAPSWSLDFGIGQMGNYGSHTFELPAGVWAFIRFAILFTTVMTVRKLIFGG